MRRITLTLLLLAFIFQGFAQQKQVFEITGRDWYMEGTLPNQGVKKQFHKYLPDAGKVITPGDVYTDLWRLGNIDDMNMGQNAQKAKWVMEYEWWYFHKFDVPKDMEDKQLHLLFEGIDYACDVYLNGKLLGSHEGQFSHFSFDVTETAILKTEPSSKGNNYLAIRLHPAPRNWAIVNGKKYRWHGDYNQNVTPTGIWQPIKLVATGTNRVKNLYARTAEIKDKTATVEFEVEVINDASANADIEAEIKLTGKNFESKDYTATIKQSVKTGVNKLTATIEVPDAKLWYPWDLGDQNLYTASVTIKKKGEFQDAESATFGIREVKMEMNLGWTAEEVEHPWTVMINGKRHFIRSGTWGGPPDRYTGRTTEDTYRELIRLAKEANINNLRIFNWHPAEIPLFYELCNEAGISVWQDIAMIHNPILQLEDEEADKYKEGIFVETIEILKQRRNHPCNIIIEGSEEILFMSSKLTRQFQLSIVEELGEVLKDFSDLHYVATSPLSSHHATDIGFKHHETAHPHGVHYGVGNVWMEEYYNAQNYAAIPELAVTSCPSTESISKFIPENELWPPGQSWGYHWADLDVLQTHNYEVFGEDYTDKSLDEFAKATQIAQGVYFQYAFELYRTRKPKMSAINFCHFILNTPDFKWATVDYYLQPKESHYYIQKCFQPLLVTLQHESRRWMPGSEFSGKLWVVNDYMESFGECNIELKILDNNKKVVKTIDNISHKISGDSSTEITDITFKVPGQMGNKFYVELEMNDKTGKVVSKNDYMFLVADADKDIEVYKKYGKASRERIQEYGYKTYRYFPGLFDHTKSVTHEWIQVDDVAKSKDGYSEQGVVED